MRSRGHIAYDEALDKRRWLTLLVDVLGYELTEWEAAKVAAADERAAERAAAAAAEEAAGDEDDVVDVVQDL